MEEHLRVRHIFRSKGMLRTVLRAVQSQWARHNYREERQRVKRELELAGSSEGASARA